MYHLKRKLINSDNSIILYFTLFSSRTVASAGCKTRSEGIIILGDFQLCSPAFLVVRVLKFGYYSLLNVHVTTKAMISITFFSCSRVSCGDKNFYFSNGITLFTLWYIIEGIIHNYM